MNTLVLSPSQAKNLVHRLNKTKGYCFTDGCRCCGSGRNFHLDSDKRLVLERNWSESRGFIEEDNFVVARIKKFKRVTAKTS